MPPIRSETMNPHRKSSGARAKSNLVLLVEASRAVRAPIVDHLTREGLAVVEATDGQEGLEKARAIKPDVVVADLYLPILDGLGLTRGLKSHQSTRHIPVIGLVGRTTELAPLRSAGFDVILRKPCMPRLLLERLRALLDRRSPGGALGQ